MARYTLNQTIEMESQRCFACGRWWALEVGRSGQCPSCKSRYTDSTEAELAKSKRTIAGLKGALARIKR